MMHRLDNFPFCHFLMSVLVESTFEDESDWLYTVWNPLLCVITLKIKRVTWAKERMEDRGAQVSCISCHYQWQIHLRAPSTVHHFDVNSNPLDDCVVIIPKDTDSIFCFLDNADLSVEPNGHFIFFNLVFAWITFFQWKYEIMSVGCKSLWHKLPRLSEDWIPKV